MKKPFCTIPKTAIILLTTCALLAIFPIGAVLAQTATVKVQPSNSAPNVGMTFTVDVTISNVQNLYGVDVSLNWNKDILRIVSASSQLGVESHSGGVLHESVYVAEDSMSQQTGTYSLVAVSEGPAAAFSGNGKIVTLTFTVVHSGHSELTLITELADKPVPPEPSNLINHTDLSSSVNAVIPEFSTVFALAVFLILATGALVFSKKRIKKNVALTVRAI
jgi:hypothetical protein